MSFASLTKKELTSLELKDCCLKAELAALLRMNGSLSLSGGRVLVDVSTENAAIARRIFSSLKKLFQVPAELLVRKKMRLKKNNVYIVRLSAGARDILEALEIISPSFEMKRDISPSLVKKTCCKRSYLRGAFMAGGSINHPESSSYHLEIFTSYAEHGQALVKLCRHFKLYPKLIERKKGYVMYLKEGEKITEFLNIIGAHQALFQFEDARIVKDMRNSVNRLVNCETANLNKTVAAAMRQIENIMLIDQRIGLDNLPDKLKEIALVRLEHPDVNLKELGELLPSGKVSKSGINHRLRKLEAIASKLRAGS
ncbi:DNA-binding protein WhiA [Caldalkalibacillus uzonensis]|uniref:Probable cell division protein WhiA n=1 Tax=Caldalkalibacillus uzonensis TaxID=353224 RepID=A0ABU0CQ05_9BACI|nr:DNA-binding protein WhiA [Caldalkalibacillus uzonensis]MDQ0338481.1 DNA-binding protein WhiA [Caldalkalibacillus uzonensis]